MTAAATRTALPGLDPGVLALPLFEPAHRGFAERVAAFAVDNLDVWGGTEDPAAHGRLILRRLGDAGLLAFLDPDVAGGGGLPGDLRALCLARQALAYADDLADFALSIQALAATPLLRHGTPDQRRRYAPGLAAGTVQAAFAITEPQAGSDAAAVACEARRDGDGWTLHGTKAWIANGNTADVCVVVARSGDGPGALGLSAFLVDAGTPGFSVEPVPMLAPRALAHLHFDGARVPARALLGRAGGGFAIAMDVLDRFRMTVGAAAVGMGRRALDSALVRARRRRIYDGRLFDLATVRAALGDAEVRLASAELLVARAAWEADRGGRFAQHSAAAKLHATEVAQQVVDACVQLHGASGLVAGSVPERLYRQIRSLRIYEGTSEVQRMVVAAALDGRRAESHHALFDPDATEEHA